MLRRTPFAAAVGLCAISCGVAPESQISDELPAQSEQALTAGSTYTFRAQHSGKCLAVEQGSVANGAFIVQTTCTDSAAQRFRVDGVGSYARLVNEGSGKCLDVSGASTAAGASIVQWSCSTTAYNQQWSITDTSGIVSFVARHSNQAIDISGASLTEGARAVQWAISGTNNQKFTATLANTAVSKYGKLSVSGTRMKANGVDVQLEGVSSMWLNWEDDGFAESATALKWMRDTWKVEMIRAAMGIDPAGAYLSDPVRAKAQVNRIVQNAINLGVYVIIDWHDHEAHLRPDAAVAFFEEMATKWGHTPNVIYEIFNEPLNVSWATTLKPYHQRVVSAIRAKDPDNIIVLGTPQWSQKVAEAAASPLTGTNLMYTLHFYTCSHTQWLRTEAQNAINLGLPLFVTEWGATHADGGLDGQICTAEADLWHSFLNTNKISWASWKLDDCADSSCLLRAGAPLNGSWDTWLQGHGSYVRSRLLD